MVRRKRSKLPVPLGGGWYRLTNGQNARGLEVAERKQKRLLAAQHETRATTSGRFNFLRQAGLQFKGIRDIYTSAGYIAEGAESFDNYWSLYERDPVAGRIVDMPPKTTWRTPPDVVEGEGADEQETDFEKAWLAMTVRLKLWRHFERVDRLSRVGRYAVLLLGVREADDMALRRPMEKMLGPEDLLYLQAYAEKYAEIKTWESDPTSPRFGLPASYEIHLSSGVSGFKGKGKKVPVHHSRIIHVAEDPLVDDVFGRPALKRALNVLADLLKVTASTGEAYWQLASRVLQGKIDPTAEMKDGAVEKMGEDLEAIVHDLRRQFIGQGVELGWLGGEVPKPSEAIEMYKSMTGVASGIPARILFGSEQGQLASSQDERSYFGMVNERQEQHAEPNILRAFIDRLIEFGLLPEAGKEGYTVIWPPLFELSDKDVAEANWTRAKAAKELTPMGGDPMTLVEVDAERNVWLTPREAVEPSTVLLVPLEE